MTPVVDSGPRSYLSSIGLLVLRLSVGGGLIAAHGWDKLIHFNERRASFPDPLGIGTDFSLVGTIAAEVLCSLLLVIGLMTRVAALPVAFTMAVAAFVVNAGKPWADKELAVLYMLCSLALVFTGAGRYSVDSRIERRKED